MRSIFVALAISLGVSTAALAGPVTFANDWKEQTFFRLNATSYGFNGATLSINAQDSSSVIYKPVSKAEWPSRSASWQWSVTNSVAPTDLTKKGGDDRNISIYFVFLDQATADKIGEKASIRKLLGSKNARMLVYVYGGAHQPGQFLPSPYLDTRGVTIIKRAAGTGSFAEKADLVADYRKAFGGTPEALVGIAISADSDDTNGSVAAQVGSLVLR